MTKWSEGGNGGGCQAQAELPRARILVVDDHAPNLLTLEATLGDLGEVVKAHSGEEALLHLLREDFALILLDVQMPGLDGFETARLIKERERSRFIPIVFLTARSRDASHVFRGYAQGAVDYVLKPFAPEILRSKVSVFVELFLKEEQLKRQEALLRRREREALERESAYRYRLLGDAMPLCVFAASPDGRLRYGNRAWTELSGLPAEAVDDLWRSEVVHPEERERVHAAWCQSVGTGQPFEVQFRLRCHGDKGYRWHLGRAVPERNERGGITGWIVTATDIDNQKRAEEELARASAAKDAFLAAASHELRTPLAAAKMQVQLAQRKFGAELKDGPRRALEGLDRQVDRMTKLVSDLLDVSRLLTGRLSLEVERFDLVPLLRATCERLQALSSEHRLKLEAPETLLMRGDPGRIEQVVTNLVSNAIRYSPQGGLVELRVWVEGGNVSLQVHDQGIGIPAEKLPLIFERFGQAHGARYGGLGLGLTISQGIIEQHGGRIWAESRGVEGGGSTFHVRMPLQSVLPDRNLPA
ncbi:sensor histidine kinase [Archangium sp.]|uniref:sensor histidine kinase n=1 Tax=Archangium sp. TaxID=1872627 RepID=UPI002D2E6187|nr:ATP-binding protein [Archangium sp.]HYO59910.1 ATP-binding protein [Archangium sp.]